MSEPFIGEIRMVGFNFAPRSWAFCDGQLLPVNQNQALFALLGTTYGGDGRTTFGLPDLRGRFPMHPGSGPGLTSRRQGDRGGVESVVLNPNEIPAHSHAMRGSGLTATEKSPANAYPAVADDGERNYTSSSDADMGSTGTAGMSRAHYNLPPYLCVYFVIALQGLFPSRN